MASNCELQSEGNMRDWENVEAQPRNQQPRQEELEGNNASFRTLQPRNASEIGAWPVYYYHSVWLGVKVAEWKEKATKYRAAHKEPDNRIEKIG